MSLNIMKLYVCPASSQTSCHLNPKSRFLRGRPLGDHGPKRHCTPRLERPPPTPSPPSLGLPAGTSLFRFFHGGGVAFFAMVCLWGTGPPRESVAVLVYPPSRTQQNRLWSSSWSDVYLTSPPPKPPHTHSTPPLPPLNLL